MRTRCLFRCERGRRKRTRKNDGDVEVAETFLHISSNKKKFGVYGPKKLIQVCFSSKFVSSPTVSNLLYSGLEEEQ